MSYVHHCMYREMYILTNTLNGVAATGKRSIGINVREVIYYILTITQLPPNSNHSAFHVSREALVSSFVCIS